MSILVRFMFLFLFPLMVMAQNYQHSLTGSFSDVDFTLSWNEASNEINGVYGDNHFISSTPVTGSKLLHSRSFVVNLPIVVDNVKTIHILAVGLTPGALPLTLTLKDFQDGIITKHTVTATLAPPNRDITAIDEGSCSTGFGSITGFCGLYSGSITETDDRYSLCYGIDSENSRLELALNTELGLYLGYRDSIVGIPRLNLGGIPNSPLTGAITSSATNCGPLAGTKFPTENCQTLTLDGDFRELTGIRSFSGTLIVNDPTLGQGCTFQVNLEREKPY